MAKGNDAWACFTALRAAILLASLLLGEPLLDRAALAVFSGSGLPVSLIKVFSGMAFGALIGYCSNRLAIWLLFNPAEPVRIWKLEFQGLIPKKREELAFKLADAVTGDILSEREVQDLLGETGEKVIRELVHEKLMLFLPPGLADRLSSPVSSVAVNVARGVLVEVARALDLKDFMVEKARSLDPRDFSRLFHKALGKELRWISLWDSMLGATMGLLESLLFSFVSF